MTAGWVAIHRQLADHPVWTGERFTRGQAWVDLILLASYADHLSFQGNRPIPVKRGQILTSQVKLAARWRWNRETVRAFLHLLESAKMAAIETSKATDTGYTLVTLLNYDLYQGSGEDMKALHSGIPSAIETPFEPASNQHPTATINKGNKGKTTTPSASDLTLAEYLEKFSSEGQEVLRQTVSAIRSTRKCGKVAQSVLDSLARKLDRYPGQVVRQACQAYLARNYASQGKAESYLLGIVRGEAKRQSGNGRNLSGTTTPPGRSTGPVDTCGRPLPYIGRPRQEDEHE